MTSPVLDDPLPLPQQIPLFQRILTGIEIALWLVSLVGLLLKMESWPGGSEILVVTFTSLTLLYLLLPIPLFGSTGWRQRLGAHVVGFALMTGLMGLLFHFESWAGARELLTIGFLSVPMLALLSTVLWLVRRSQGTNWQFYRNMALRLIPIFLVLAKMFFLQ